ncbi:DUF6644 family protein [Phenylobacterium sp.]|jgi:hypothetical protein|uniref:DUF6644 family protein n=1 Tax=Phenylobacterium sp. TaxID=1871053 RepID=UPI0035AE7144
MLYQFCDWLQNTAFGLYIQDEFWVIPMLQSAHILGIGVLFVSIAMIDLRVLGVRDKFGPVSTSSRQLLPWTWVGLGVLVLTGALLFCGEATRCFINPGFRWKMVLLVVGVLTTIYFQRTVGQAVASDADNAARTPAVKLAAALSLSAWVGVIVLGRWIAYLDTGSASA